MKDKNTDSFKKKNENSQQDKIWNGHFTSVFIANALLYLGQWMVQPIITKYASDIGAAASVLGFVAGAFAVTAIIFKLIAAPAIDSFNKKYVLFAAIIVMSTAFFGYSVSVTVSAIILFRLLQGAGQAFTATCCLAMAVDALPKNKIGMGIGAFTLAQAMSQAIAPTIGLTVAERYGFNVTFRLAGAIMLIASFMAIRIRSKPPEEKKRFKISLASTISKPSLLPAFLLLLLSACSCLINSYLVIFASMRKVEGIGYYFTVYAGSLLLTRPLFGKFSDKYGIVKVVIPALFFFAGSFFIISLSNNLPMFLLAAFTAAFGFGASQPLINVLCIKTVPPERRGSASSTAYIGSDLGNIIGPVVAGAIAGIAGYSSMWMIMTTVIFLAIIIVFVFREKIKIIETEFNTKA